MPITLKFTALLFSALLLMSGPANAQPLSEASTLKRVLLELDAVKPLIEEAQRRSDRQDRLRFNYHCLVSDLNIIKHGIRAAIYAVKHQTRQYQALCGDYGFTGQLGGESASLSMLMNELQGLTPIINEAKHHANHSLRAKMNYQALSGDLDTIISAIQHALMGAGDQPRTFPALRGGYSQ